MNTFTNHRLVALAVIGLGAGPRSDRRLGVDASH